MRETLDISNLEFASYSQRIGARIIDFFIVSMLFGFFLQLVHVEITQMTMQEMMKSTDPTMGLGLWILILPILFVAYEVPSLASNGITIGKRIMGICVVRTDGLIGIGLDRALLRVVIPLIIAIIPVINFFYLIGQFWFLVDPLRQNIPDKIARTYVVRKSTGMVTATEDSQDIGQ